MRALPIAVLAAATVLVTAAGCVQPGTPEPGSSSDDLQAVFDVRAQDVVDAWEASTASGAWLTGFVPLQELTVPPAGGFPSDEAKQAFAAGWYVLRTELPDTRPADGMVTFADDGTLAVPLTSARDAYAAVDQGDPPPCGSPGTGQPPVPEPTAGPDVSTSSPVSGCVALTVLGARLGTTTLRTSRGEATVPAWLFTVTGIRGHVARVAVAPSAVAALPSPTLPEFTHRQGLVTAQDLVGTDGSALTYRLGVGACDKDVTPLFLETEDAVLVAGTVRTAEGVCIDLLKLEPVTVTLAEPLGGRVVLDALNGRPLTLTVR